MNNRNCKPRVSLRMADGGVWGAVKGVFSSAPQETMTQKFARQDAERAAKAAKAAPAAPAVSTPAAASAGAGIGGYATDAALKDREARAMKAAGLRDGGEVPGSGRGDKIPALYEPGEFVVSNAMLKKAPGLRDQLHELREETLAGQGKTVAQADANAVRGGLRADAGGSWYDDPTKRPGEQNGQVVPGITAQRAGAATGGGVDSGATGDQRGLLRTLTDQAFPATSTILRGRGEDAAYEASKGNWSGAAMHGIRGGLEGAGALGLDVARPVLRALEPVGRGITNTAYSVATGDSTPLVSASATQVPLTTPPTAPTPNPTLRTGYDADLPGQDPGRITLRGRAGSDVAGAPDVQRFTENGRTLYSNVPGDNAGMAGKNLVGIVPGMPQAQIDRVLTNPDGSRWSAADNAVMAANLRDGIDPYRGTSRQKGEDEAAQEKGMRELAFSKQGTPGRLGAMKMFSEQQQNRTLRRGQDLLYRAATYGHELNAETARAKQNYEMNKDRRDFEAGRYDKGLEQGDKARDSGAREFLSYNPDGKANDALSAARYDAVRKVMPGADIMSPQGRSKNLPEMKALASIYDRIAANPQMGIDKINPLEPKGPGLDTMPDWKGGKLVRQGLTGAITPGSSVNGYYVSHKGRDIPLGRDLSERELEILDHHLRTGDWAGAPTNIQRGK